MKKIMYAVILIFALTLLSPLPFVSPFASIAAAEPQFETQDPSSFAPPNPVTTTNIDGPVTLTASRIAYDTVLVKAAVNNIPSFSFTATSDEFPFNFPSSVFEISGTDTDGNNIPNVNSESWFAHEHIEVSYIGNNTENGPYLNNSAMSTIPFINRASDEGLKFGHSMTHLGDIDGDGVSDLGIGSPGHGDTVETEIELDERITGYIVHHQDRGGFFTMLMNADGTIKSTTKFDYKSDNMPNLENPQLTPLDYSFGDSIESLGDLYNDGTVVVAIGATGATDIANREGVVFIFRLGDNGTKILDSYKITAAEMGRTFHKSTYFGRSVENIGDVDNNGVPDLAIGATGVYLPASEANGSTTVAVWFTV